MLGYVFVALTVLFTVYGQLILKWRVGLAGQAAGGIDGKISFLLHTLGDPWTLSGLAAAFVASLFWILALSKLELSQAYPFTAASIVLVLMSSIAIFGESPNAGKIAGTLIVAVGIIVVAASSR
jgi:multidrug transporter EmrE-like cation transporter